MLKHDVIIGCERFGRTALDGEAVAGIISQFNIDRFAARVARPVPVIEVTLPTQVIIFAPGAEIALVERRHDWGDESLTRSHAVILQKSGDNGFYREFKV